MDELSESNADDEQIQILQASRADAPPRKRRRLNNSESQPQQYEDSTESDTLSDEKSPSDKENSYSTNTQNNKKRRRAPLSNKPSTNEIHKFGNQSYDFAINTNPGAMVRLKLQNFLCHDNFEIVFHPNVNIIYGQNGSGKSAVEAGISMALGQNSKKTGRGSKVKDVIKDGKQWAKITLCLHNQGPERLTEYGNEIIIERRLSMTGKNGTSYFKVLDGATMKSKGTGMKAVRAIADKFNLNVDNPCVVLKQSVAKEFLNSTKATDKFKFFMQASKLGNYVTCLDEARANVKESQQRQRQTKGSFAAIKSQYFEAKQKLQTLEQMEDQKDKVKYWKRAEKYMIYHKEKDKIHAYRNKMESVKTKIEKGKVQLEKVKEEMVENIERAKATKDEIETEKAKADRHIKPVNELRKKMGELNKERKAINSKVNAKHRFVDKSKRKIKDFTRQYNDCLKSIQNNERGRKLAAIQERLNEYTNKLNEYRTQIDPLKQKSEKTIEMKENEKRLISKQNVTYGIRTEMDKLQRQLNQLNQERNRSEYFLAPALKSHGRGRGSYRQNRNEISIHAIRTVLQKHKRQFSRMPIGPLGEYVNMISTNNREEDDRNIQIVQTVLGQSLFVFLVDSSKDMQTFGQIMQRTFSKTIPCIQYPYSNSREEINVNPFDNYQCNDGDGPLLRVAKMFTIKDNNAWVYNAILTNSQPERVYAHGDLARAKNFLSSLDANRLRAVNCVMTYREKGGLYKVTKKGHTISGTPKQTMQPILQTDTTKMKQWFQTQLNVKIGNKNKVDIEIQELDRFVGENNRSVKEYGRKLMGLNRNIHKLEDNIEKLQRQQREMQEEEEGNEELENTLQELQNCIEDEKMNVGQFDEEIKPFKEREKEILISLSGYKKEMNDIEYKIKNEKHSIDMLRHKFEGLMMKIKKHKVITQKVPAKIMEFERELMRDSEAYELEKGRINGLLSAAQTLGEEISKDNYPRNPADRNRVFKLNGLRGARETLESEIEAWEDELGMVDADDIRMRFESIKPKYEQHQQKVDTCNSNCDEMMKLLHNRTKEYHLMKESVRDRLSLEFRYIMKQQGHDGKLHIDYDNATLDMECSMASHDGSSQVRNTKTLSGGERSYAQVALIMALQKFSGSPMCIYDEFDVFMDSVNRGNSIKILLNAALGHDPRKNKANQNQNQNRNNKKEVSVGERQYIFITPNDVSPIIAQGHSNEVRIHQLKPPRRN